MARFYWPSTGFLLGFIRVLWVGTRFGTRFNLVELGFYRVLPSFPEVPEVLEVGLGFYGFLLLPGLGRLFLLWLGFTGFNGFYRVFMNFNGFFTRLYWVLPGFHEFSWVFIGLLLGFTEFYRVLTNSNGFS